MSVRTAIVLLLALCTLSILVGCGSSASSTTITPPPTGAFSNANLNGTYVFSVSGTDFDGNAYAIVGTFIANGQSTGGITGGTIDIVDPIATPVFDLAINNNGFYTVGVDGRGKITIGTATANPFTSFGNGDMTFDFVLANSSQGLITEFDGNATGSGTIDLQTTAAPTLTGSYAFSFSGATPTPSPFATVGDFTVTGGAITGLEDFNADSIPYADFTLGGTVIPGPSTTPATQLTTNSSFGVDGTVTFDVYAIDATHLKFIEADSAGTLSGDAYSQTSTAFPTGTLAFTLEGFLPVSGNDPFAAGGFMVTDGQGDITATSTEDFNEAGTVLSATAPVQFSGSYVNLPAGSGRYTLSNFSGFAGGSSYAAYPSSGGVLMLEVDASGGLTMGAAYAPQSTTAFGAAAQGYALNLTGVNFASGSAEEVDDIAEFTAAATGDTCDAAGDTICGAIDENYEPSGVPIPDLAFSQGTYGTVGTVPGRYGLSAADGNSSTSTLEGGFNLTFYTVDGSTFPFMEMDSTQVATGVFLLQNPTASSSSVARTHMFVPQHLARPSGALRKKK
jgi:hypothetical protein